VPEMQWGATEVMQLLVALATGVLIGLQREMHYKPAGVSTMSIVSVTSALLMQLSIKLGSSVNDPARLAAAVITGIGFLGAGVIIQTGREVHGITTAATIWLVSATGLAIGAGYYGPALIAVALAWLMLGLDPLIDRWTHRQQLEQSSRSNQPDQPEPPDSL
jgi:putative Mg2+ transporter-C (MgtC) family protein